jgi:osmotically-inducible protein OsmY
MKNETWQWRGYGYNRALEPTGLYRRRLPRNYKRSDQRILEEINDRLIEDPFVDASEIEVMLDQHEVTLTGTVDNRITKRRVEDIVEFIPGIKNVENKLRTKHRIVRIRL